MAASPASRRLMSRRRARALRALRSPAADLRRIYSDAENFQKRGNTGFARLIGEDWDIIPTELDPPEHSGLRQAQNPIFAPRKMMHLDSLVRYRARPFIDRFRSVR